MTLLSVEEALARVVERAELTAGEEVGLLDAPGRVLAAPLAAGHDQPPFAASAMDGYAVRSADLVRLPARLGVIGQAAAGRGFAGCVGTGEAVRIFTGAPVPRGADAVVIQENTRVEGDTVLVAKGVPDSEHVRRAGLDFRRGDTLLMPPLRLGTREIALAAAMGHAHVPVRRKPRVAILATGDELVLPGTPPAADRIVCSNAFGIAALVSQAGGAVDFLGIARDTPEDLAAKSDAGRAADILVTIGGASVGDHDLVAPVLQARGLKLAFWKIALRPGKPLMFGTRGSQHVLGLPGNPVSALICARIFLVPLIWRMLGLPETETQMLRGRLAVAVEANGPRRHYMRVVLEPTADIPMVRPISSQDSSLLKPLAAANALLVRPPDARALPAGTEVSVLPIDF